MPGEGIRSARAGAFWQAGYLAEPASEIYWFIGSAAAAVAMYFE